MKFLLACLAVLLLPQSISGMGHAAVKVKLIGLVQSTGTGTLGNRSLNLWATWARGAGYHVELDIQTYVKDSVATDIAGLIAGVPNGTHGILIPPYGSGDTKAFIAALPAGTTMPIMVWGGASDSIFSSSCLGKHCFGTFTVGSKYMTLGLQAILAKSSKPLTVGLVQNDNAFSDSVASGAATYINSTEGLTLGAHVTVTRGAVTSDELAAVGSLIAMKPQIIAIAGHSGGDVETVIAEVKKSLTPAAILATNSITAGAKAQFVKMNMESAMMCVMMPTQWGQSKDAADPYTKWTSDAFKQAFGEGVSYHAASAAAAGIAITDAINTVATSSHSLVDALKAVDLTSFYGPIKFNTDGSINKPMYVQQSQAKGSPVFTTMFGDLAYPLSSCSGWGKGKTCGDVRKFYKEKGCCGQGNKTVDLKDLNKYEIDEKMDDKD